MLPLCLGSHPLLLIQELCFYNFFCIFNYFLFTGSLLQEHNAVRLIFRTIKPKPSIFDPTPQSSNHPIFLLLPTAKLLGRVASHLHFLISSTNHSTKTFRRWPVTSEFQNPMLYSVFIQLKLSGYAHVM